MRLKDFLEFRDIPENKETIFEYLHGKFSEAAEHLQNLEEFLVGMEYLDEDKRELVLDKFLLDIMYSLGYVNAKTKIELCEEQIEFLGEIGVDEQVRSFVKECATDLFIDENGKRLETPRIQKRETPAMQVMASQALFRYEEGFIEYSDKMVTILPGESFIAEYIYSPEGICVASCAHLRDMSFIVEDIIEGILSLNFNATLKEKMDMQKALYDLTRAGGESLLVQLYENVVVDLLG